MTHVIVALPGDGIGPEVIATAVEVLAWCGRNHGLELEVRTFPAGGAALERYGDPLPDFVLAACREADAILVGAAGDSRFDSNPARMRPEQALLRLRKELGLFTNLRPVKPCPSLLDTSPFKKSIIENVDIMIVRELTGGIYFGEPRGTERRAGVRCAYNMEIYHDYEIERIARVAFQLAGERSRLVTSVDKSNVMESSLLWRTVVEEVAQEFPDVALEHMLVDNCSMQLISRPRHFDVLLSTNLFGDILSDEAAVLAGSIGLLPSASLGAPNEGVRKGLYEPVHGTAPDIAGRGRANPLAAISSVALMFRYSLGREDIAGQIDAAVELSLRQGHRTADLVPAGKDSIGTRVMAEKVLEALAGDSDSMR
jgi:3-isopropylmalate dehydrogenase